MNDFKQIKLNNKCKCIMHNNKDVIGNLEESKY